MISKIIPEEKIIKVKNLLYDADSVAIVAHASPDGDAIGAALAMYHFLFTINKEATVIIPDRFPNFLSWMKGAEKAVIYQEDTAKATEILNSVDLIFCVDFNEPKRVGIMKDALVASPAKKILLDHHLDPQDFCDITISHTNLASTSEIVFRLICRTGHFAEINKYCAEAIYTGMMTDTGAFTYRSNDTEIYYIIGELIKKGIDKDLIYRNVYNNSTADRVRLMGYVLSEKMQIFPEHKAAIITLSMEEQKRFNFQKGDAEGFVNIPLSIQGIIFSIFLKEDVEQIKVSLRSQGDFPVNKVAHEYFNGGGHLNASGGELKISLDEAEKLAVSILPIYTNLLNKE